ncbi:MAG TPA: type II toxin-antitoxin system RelE/ParE family toxin [Polyangiaceae bacterium]|nr:type II toxin-antitoxin system RelE/ParE family toxin [Polyangiaceae bacterium]
MTVLFSPEAELDLATTLEHLAERNTDAAEALRLDVFRQLSLLDEGAVDGALTTLRSGRRVRRWLVYPLWVYYRRQGSVLEVVRVYHHARRPLER